MPTFSDVQRNSRQRCFSFGGRLFLQMCNENVLEEGLLERAEKFLPTASFQICNETLGSLVWTAEEGYSCR